MAELKQIAGVLDIEVEQSDDWSQLLDFDIDLSGYTFESKVDELDSSDSTTITVTDTNLSEGQITLSLTDELVGALAIGRHSWYLEWTVGELVRRVLAGKFDVV